MQHVFIRRNGFTLLAILAGLLTPITLFAEITITTPKPIFMDPCWGGVVCSSMDPVVQNMNDALFLAASSIALAIFVIGAFLMVISAGNDENLQRAKRAMKGSIIGLALIVGSYGIYRTIVAIVYP